MGIYSRNRSGSVSASMAACNENYGPSDIGRIMYESVVNDNSIFEAIVMCDLTESKCLREGTLLEAEAKKFSKENVKKILDAIKERVKKFWEKIKGAIQAAIRKFAAYILRDGKAFVKDFKESTKNKKFTGEIKDVTFYDYEEIDPVEIDSIENEIKNAKNDENFDSSIYTAKMLSKMAGQSVNTTKEFREAVLKGCSVKYTITSSNINDLLDMIENAPKMVKTLKDYEKVAAKQVDKIGAKLKEAERELNKEDDNIDHGKIIKNITAIVSTFETCISASTSVTIFMIQQDVKIARVTLGKIKNEMEDVKHEATFIESAAIVDAEDVDAALNSDEPVDPEVDKEIEKIEIEA